MIITASQCRSARTLLRWSIGRLANSASVRERDIDDFELEPSVFDKLRSAYLGRRLRAKARVDAGVAAVDADPPTWLNPSPRDVDLSRSVRGPSCAAMSNGRLSRHRVRSYVPPLVNGGTLHI